MKKKVILFLIPSFLFLVYSSFPILAQTITPTPTLGNDTASEIQQLRQVIQQKVHEKLQEISQNPAENPRKAYFGTITEFDATSLKINTKTQNLAFILDDTTTYIARSHSYSGGSVLVRSINDHLSFGGGFGISSSTTNNLELSLRIAPTVEYDFFKYDQYPTIRHQVYIRTKNINDLNCFFNLYILSINPIIDDGFRRIGSKIMFL